MKLRAMEADMAQAGEKLKMAKTEFEKVNVAFVSTMASSLSTCLLMLQHILV